MKSVNRIQIGIITGAIVLFVLLFFANKKPLKKAEELVNKPVETSVTDFNTLIAVRMQALPAPLKQRLTSLTKEMESQEGNVMAIDSLVFYWDRMNQPDIASYYTEKKAMQLNTAPAWFKAGERYFYAVRFVTADRAPALYQSAINCFSKGLAIDPANTDAKINLAACYVDGTADPMKGIGMLREIEKTDSNNVNLQLTFALFSSKSGQWLKAIQRYQKVIRLKPDYLEAYLYLADAFEKNGDKPKTIESLEKFVSLSKDSLTKNEVRNYINKLKTNS